MAIEKVPTAKGVVEAWSGIQMFIRGIAVATLILNAAAAFYHNVTDKFTQNTFAATRFFMVAICMAITMMDPVVYATVASGKDSKLNYMTIYIMFAATWLYGLISFVGVFYISVEDCALFKVKSSVGGEGEAKDQENGKKEAKKAMTLDEAKAAAEKARKKADDAKAAATAARAKATEAKKASDEAEENAKKAEKKADEAEAEAKEAQEAFKKMEDAALLGATEVN